MARETHKALIIFLNFAALIGGAILISTVFGVAIGLGVGLIGYALMPVIV